MPIELRPKITACGLLFCYNEEHILRYTLEYYLSQGIDIVVFDNCSTDGSAAIVAEYMGSAGTGPGRFPGRVIERVEVVTDGYAWGKILKTAGDFMHQRLSGYDWILTIDADGFYQSPVRGASLIGFMADMQRLGRNVIDGKLFDFYPTAEDDPAIGDPLERLRYCSVETYGALPQHKLFRYHPSVDFHTHMGHTVLREGASPGEVRFLYRHYPWTSYEHGLQKIFTDRKPRYVQRKENPIYHIHYLELLPRREDLVKEAGSLTCFDEDGELISRAALFAAEAGKRLEPGLEAAMEAARLAARAGGRMPSLGRRFVEVAREDRTLAVRKATSYAARGLRKAASLTGVAAPAADGGAPPGGDCAARQDMPAAAAAEPAVDAAACPGERPLPPAPDKSVTEEEVMAQRAAAVGFPVTYHFLMTTACNARCVFCNQDASQPRQEITLEKFKVMVSHIPVQSARFFYLSGGGDPLLCRDFFPILRYINAEFPWIRVHVRTNGLLLKKYAAELAGTDIRLELSVHAASEQLNNRMLQSRKAADIFAGLELLDQELARRGKTMEKAFFPALSQLNIGELPALIEKAAELGVSAVESYFCRCYVGDAYPGENRIRQEDSLYYNQEEYDRVVTECEQLAARLGVCFMHEARFCEGFQSKRCYEPWRMMLVDWDGEVFPCCGGEMWFKKQVDEGVYRFGNLLEEDLYQLWNNETYVMIRRTLSPHYDDDLVPECADCHSILCFRGPNVEAGHVIRVDRL